MPRTRAAQQEWEACSTYVMFYDAIWHFNAFSSLNSICAASFGPFSWSSSSALTQKNLMPGPQRRPPFGTARRHHFFETRLPLPAVVLNHVVLIFVRKPPRIESDASGFGICIVLAVVSAHAVVFPSSANCFATLSWLTPRSSSHSISPGSTLQGCGCDRSGARPVRKTAVQPGSFLALHIIFFCEKCWEKRTRFGCQIPAQKWGRFPAPYSN